jgi:di/tricarboxylate transporter
LRETGVVAWVTQRLLGRPRGEREALVRLIGPVVVASAFLNNTTLVASLLPGVTEWARRLGVSPARLLMPLSFAAILGGTCTMVGTSTNLVVQGLILERVADTPGLRPLGLFEISPLGLAVALSGGLVMVLLAPALLPDRRPPVSAEGDPRRYTMELRVSAGSALVGQTVEEAGLRHLPGGYLMEIVREEGVLPAVEPTERLRAGDGLVLVGDLERMVDLQRWPGLEVAAESRFGWKVPGQQRRIVEAVVSPSHPLIGTSLREGNFRARYHAVVMAVARSGERLAGRLGDVALRAGDVLLLDAHPDFLLQHRQGEHFTLVSPVEGASPPRQEKAALAGLILVAVVGSISLDLWPAVTVALGGAGAMVLSGCVTLEEARRSLDLSILVAIAAAFGLGEAIEGTGLDGAVAGLATAAGVDSPWAGLILVYLVTAALTELVTNNAAAVLAVPIAISLAERLGVSPLPYAVAVMFAASASFLTPIGYQCNLMVYNAGGYKPFDYVRLGLPVAIACFVATIALIPWLWPF